MYSYEDDTFYEGEGYDSEQEEWMQFLNTIKAETLLQRQENLQGLWTHLRRDEPELLDTFEFFLDNAVREIDRIRGDKNIALKSKEQSEREAQQIFIDVERILEEERERIKTECEERYRYELRRQTDAKQQELDDVTERKRGLERQLADINVSEKRSSESIRNLNKVIEELTCRENELKVENDDLLQENHRLHMQLSVSLDSLQRSQELCVKLHEKAEIEKREIVREFQDAVAQKQENLRDNSSSDFQLEHLKQRLLDGEKCHNDANMNLAVQSPQYECDEETPVVQSATDTYKVIMVGDSNVGKTSLIQRFCENQFSGDRNPTLDITYQTKDVITDNGTSTLQLWDTAGQERFRSIPKSYFRKADGIMMIYDVTNEKSIKNVRHWISCAEVTKTPTVVMLIGNKLDCSPEISRKTGCKMAEEIGAGFSLVSAKTGENVEEAFQLLTKLLMAEKYDVLAPPGANIVAESIELEIQALADHKKKGCCW